jgi:hypothetical protein
MLQCTSVVANHTTVPIYQRSNATMNDFDYFDEEHPIAKKTHNQRCAKNSCGEVIIATRTVAYVCCLAKRKG